MISAYRIAFSLSTLLLASCLSPVPTTVTLYTNPRMPVEARVADLLSRMSLSEKVGQMVMAGSTNFPRPVDAARQPPGAILLEGSSLTAAAAEAFQEAAMSTRLRVPFLLASQTAGPVVFPDAAGLAAAGNTTLAREVGRAEAEELAVLGVRWLAAPAALPAAIRGLQGADISRPSSILATLEPFPSGPAEAAVDVPESLKAALVYGVSMLRVPRDADARLVTGMLKDRLGFDGVVVTWISEAGGAETDLSAALRASVGAGIDMVAAPTDGARIAGILAREAERGGIARERVDDAVRRILRVKLRAGLFETPLPAAAALPRLDTVEHREVARRAVRESVVLLKNDEGFLPLPRSLGRILVTGSAAADLAAQCGAASGTPSVAEDGAAAGAAAAAPRGTPLEGTTVLQAIGEALSAPSSLVYDPGARRAAEGFSAAVAVIDGGGGLSEADRAALARLEAAGLPVAVVVLSDGPLDVAGLLPGAKALLAAWRPGTEGEGVADVLFGLYNPSGKLPGEWPRSTAGGDTAPLFPAGFGLGYR
jgi:beta-glucosidase